MKIDEKYPTPKDLRSNELLTMAFFQNDVYLKQEYPTFAHDCYQYYTYFKGTQGKDLEFESELEIQINSQDGKVNGKAYIGGKFYEDRKKKIIAPSYSMAISVVDSKRLLRRFHFDYILPDSARRQPHPIFHLQYAGKLSPRLKRDGFEHDHMDPWLSEPRLFFIPMSLALLVNTVLKEFPDERTEKIIERPEWRNLIRKNENLLLTPYFRCCNLFLSSNRTDQLLTKTDQLFTNDFCYGN